MTQHKGFPLRAREALIERLQQNELRMKTQIRNLELERDTLRYRLESLRKAKCVTVTRKESRTSQIHVEADHTSLPKLDLGTAHQSCDKQTSKKRTVSETFTLQPQSVEGVELLQTEDEITLHLQEKQHKAEISQLKEESAMRKKVDTF